MPSPLSLDVARDLLRTTSLKDAIAVLANTIGWEAKEVIDELRPVAGPVRLELFIALIRAFFAPTDPTVPSGIYGEIGAAHRIRNHPDLAKLFYESALENATSDAEAAAALNGLGLVALEAGELPTSERTLERARAKCVSNHLTGSLLVNVLMNLGQVVARRQEPERARETFADAVAAAQADAPALLPMVLLAFAQFDLAQGDRGRAAELTAALSPSALRPEDAVAYHALREQLFDTAANGAAALEQVVALARVAAVDPKELPRLRQSLRLGDVPLYQVASRFQDSTSGAKASAAGCWQVLHAIREAALEARDAAALMGSTMMMLTHSEGQGPSMIDLLEGAIESALGARGPVLRGLRMGLHLKLGELYLDRPAHLKDAIATFERGLRDARALPGIDPSLIAPLHGYLGIAYRRLDRDSAPDALERAIVHLEAAEKLTPATAEFAWLRDMVRNSLANAQAEVAIGDIVGLKLSSVEGRDPGEPNESKTAGLRRSIQSQEALLGGGDPLDRATAEFNLAQGYIDLAKFDVDAERAEHLRRAEAHAAAATEMAAALDNPMLTVAASMAALQIASAAGAAVAALEARIGRLELDLRRGREVPAYLWVQARRTAARVANALGQRGRAYRHLLRCLSRLQGDGAISMSLVVAAELGHYLLEWGDPDRALFFIAPNLRPSRRWPGGRRWRTEPGTAAAVWHVSVESSGRSSSILVVDEAGVHARPVDLAFETVLACRARWQSALDAQPAAQAGAEDAQQYWLEAVRTIGVAIWGTFLLPVVDLLKGHRTIYLVPTFPVEGLPLHLAEFVTGKGERRSLRDLCTLSYAASFGFEAPLEPSGTGAFVGLHSPKNAELAFGALEVAGIGRWFEPGSTPVFEARSEDLLTGISRCRVVHLTCHGEFDPINPLKSVLHLADRSVSLREIQLRLTESPCSLIVLSACEAGAVGVEPGANTGFPRILLRGGCRQVIASFWRVDDLVSSLVMIGLHQTMALRKASPADALALTQSWLRQSGGSALALLALTCEPEADGHMTPEQQAHVSTRLSALGQDPRASPFAGAEHSGAFFIEADCVPLLPRSESPQARQAFAPNLKDLLTTFLQRIHDRGGGRKKHPREEHLFVHLRLDSSIGGRRNPGWG